METYLEAFKSKLIGKWVYLKKHPDPEMYWTKVKITEVDTKDNRATIQVAKDKFEKVKFSQLAPIPYAPESEVLKLQTEFEKKMQYWNSTAKDKLKNPEDERCDWLFHKTKSWFIAEDQVRLVETMSFNLSAIDYLQNIINLVESNNRKTLTYIL